LNPADETRLGILRRRLLVILSNRVPQGFDDKILADCNGLVIAALADAGLLLALRLRRAFKRRRG
jgi:uncharacterized protein